MDNALRLAYSGDPAVGSVNAPSSSSRSKLSLVSNCARTDGTVDVRELFSAASQLQHDISYLLEALVELNERRDKLFQGYQAFTDLSELLSLLIGATGDQPRIDEHEHTNLRYRMHQIQATLRSVEVALERSLRLPKVQRSLPRE